MTTDTVHMRLYIAGQTQRSTRALRNLRAICETHLAGRFDLEVVDVIQRPEMARDHDILAIPTLVRRLPEPVRQIIGDLSDHERVLVGLELWSDA